MDNITLIEKIEQKPEGFCFSNVNNSEFLDSEGYLAVHGKVFSKDNRIIDHAWIEFENKVIDPTAGIIIDKQKYYFLTKAIAEAKYSQIDALRNVIKSGNQGPWNKKEVGDRYIWRIDGVKDSL